MRKRKNQNTKELCSLWLQVHDQKFKRHMESRREDHVLTVISKLLKEEDINLSRSPAVAVVTSALRKQLE